MLNTRSRSASHLSLTIAGVPVLLRLTSEASHSGVAVDLPNIEKAIDALLGAKL